MYLPLVREMVKVLMESSCYFHLKLEERHRLVKYLLLETGPCEPAVSSARPVATHNMSGGFTLKKTVFPVTAIPVLTLGNPMGYHGMPGSPDMDGFPENTAQKS